MTISKHKEDRLAIANCPLEGRRPESYTCLHIMVSENDNQNDKMGHIKRLIELKADVNAREVNMRIPIHLSIGGGPARIVRAIVF